MRFDVSHLVTGRGRDRLQRPDLVGDQVLDLRCLEAGNWTAAKPMQVAVARMSADADPAGLRKLDGPAHDVRVAGVKAAGDIHGCGKLDHCGVVAHLPSAKSFTEIAIEIDGAHVVSPCASGSLVGRQRVSWRRYLPCSGVDGAYGGARDVSITESLDVEIKLVDRTEPVGQGA